MTKHQAQPYEQAAYKIRVGEWQRKGRGGVFAASSGAYFSGIASASMHGWLWLVAAFVDGACAAHFGVKGREFPINRDRAALVSAAMFRVRNVK